MAATFPIISENPEDFNRIFEKCSCILVQAYSRAGHSFVRLRARDKNQQDCFLYTEACHRPQGDFITKRLRFWSPCDQKPDGSTFRGEKMAEKKQWRLPASAGCYIIEETAEVLAELGREYV